MARDETRPLDAAAAWHAARAGKAGSRILGWKLDRAERAGLIERFPPTYDHVVADHVTLAASMGAGAPMTATASRRRWSKSPALLIAERGARKAG